LGVYRPTEEEEGGREEPRTRKFTVLRKRAAKGGERRWERRSLASPTIKPEKALFNQSKLFSRQKEEKRKAGPKFQMKNIWVKKVKRNMN